MRKAFIIALLAGTILSAPVPARAEPISTAIGLTALFTSLGASVGVAGLIGGALVSGAISVGLNLVAGLFAADPAAQTSAAAASGNDLTTTYGGDVPRASIFGLAATAGHLIYANVFGDTNQALQAVYVLGDGLHDGLSRLWFNGKLVTLEDPVSGDNGAVRYVTEFRDPGNGNPLVHVRFFDGRWDQEADGFLVNDANPPGRWTTDHRGRGVCYISITQFYHEDLGLTGYPQILAETRGLKLYDVRKDTTAGGSGSHRWGDPSTYEWSDNPSVQEYNFRRGVFIDDQLIVGMGVSSSDLIKPMYVAAANACDEDVPLKDGGTEKRYRCGFTASCDRQHSDSITVMRNAMAGYSLERVGQFGPIAGVAQFPSFEFSDDDFETGKAFSYSQYRTRSEIATAIHGNFSDPDQQWAAVPFPARIDTDDDAAMGERLERDVDLTQVYSPSQAQRVAEIERRRLMMQANGTAPLPARFIGVQPGDWGTYTTRGIDVVVKAVTRNTDHSVTVTWDAIDSAVFSWTTAGEIDAPGVPTRGQHGTRTNLVTGLGGEGIDVPADNGLVQAGLEVTWDAISDPTVQAVVLEYRSHDAGGDWSRFEATVPGTGVGAITAGIQAGTVYEVRASLLVDPLRATGVTDAILITSGANHVVPLSLESITTRLASFEAGLKAAVLGTLRLADQLDKQEQRIALSAADQDAANWTDKKEVRSDLSYARDDLSASIEEVRTVALDTDAAFASYQVTVSARFATNEASISTNATAISGVSSSFSSYVTTATASINGLTASVSTNATSIATVDGKLNASYGMTVDANGVVSSIKLLSNGVTSGIKFRADLFAFYLSSGAQLPFLVAANVNGVPTLALSGNMLADGAVTARTVTTGNLITVSAQIANLTVETIHIKNANIVVAGINGGIGGGSLVAAGIVTTAAVTLNYTGVAGSQVVIEVTGTVALKNNVNSAAAPQLYVEIAGGDVVSQFWGLGASFSDLTGIFGAGSFTASGGPQSVICRIKVNAGAFNIDHISTIMTAKAFLR